MLGELRALQDVKVDGGGLFDHTKALYEPVTLICKADVR